MVVRQGGGRSELNGRGKISDCLVNHSRPHFSYTFIIIGIGLSRIDLDGLVVVSHRSIEFAQSQSCISPVNISLGKLAIEAYCFIVVGQSAGEIVHVFPMVGAFKENKPATPAPPHPLFIVFKPSCPATRTPSRH